MNIGGRVGGLQSNIHNRVGGHLQAMPCSFLFHGEERVNMSDEEQQKVSRRFLSNRYIHALDFRTRLLNIGCRVGGLSDGLLSNMKLKEEIL